MISLDLLPWYEDIKMNHKYCFFFVTIKLYNCFGFDIYFLDAVAALAHTPVLSRFLGSHAGKSKMLESFLKMLQDCKCSFHIKCSAVSWFLRSTSWFWGFFHDSLHNVPVFPFFNLSWNLVSELFSILLLKEFFAEDSFPDALKQFKDLKLAKINQN